MWTSFSSSSSSSTSRSVSSSTSSSSTSRSVSSSTSSSSSPSPVSDSPLPKTMEEVWKDITITADLNDHNGHRDGGMMIFQDFLSKDPTPTVVSSPPPQPVAPPTMLTLYSAAETHHHNHQFRTSTLLHEPNINHHYVHHHRQHVIMPSNYSTDVPFDALAPFPHQDKADAGGGPGKKRLPDLDGNSGDRRQKRMVKNRESAARSRARKQAYMNELELEVAHLLEENARLKEQQQQPQYLYVAAAAQQQKKKPSSSLHRSSTAPF